MQYICYSTPVKCHLTPNDVRIHSLITTDLETYSTACYIKRRGQ